MSFEKTQYAFWEKIFCFNMEFSKHTGNAQQTHNIHVLWTCYISSTVMTLSCVKPWRNWLILLGKHYCLFLND